MFSVSPAEMVTIALVALVVFGPKRLPEIARKAGRIFRELRDAASDLRSDFEKEYDDALKPLDDARRAVKDTLGDLDTTPGIRRTPGVRNPPPAGTAEQPDSPAADPTDPTDQRTEPEPSDGPASDAGDEGVS